MKYKYNIKNLDCANCAKKIEEKLNKDKNIKNAIVNFSASTVSVETDLEKSFEYVKQIVSEVEPDAILSEEKVKEDNYKIFYQIIIGGILGLIGCITKLPYHLNLIIIIISYIGGFLSIQTNTITKSLNQIININPYFIGIIIVIITSFIIFGGLTKISDATSKIVPVMGVFYLLITIYIIINNISSIPNIFLSIVSEAFNFKSFYSGFLTSFVVGIQRGIFSNEAGLGTGSIASSISDINPVKQGYIQILGVYITSLIICTSTAFIILTSNYLQPVFNDLNGIEITGYAFSYHLGKLGDIFIFISILLFSFSTILTGYYYGESSLKYFFSTIKSKYLYSLKVFTLIILFLGCILSSNLLWKIVDILVALLAIINIYAMFNLRNTVFNETNYSKYDKM